MNIKLSLILSVAEYNSLNNICKAHELLVPTYTDEYICLRDVLIGEWTKSSDTFDVQTLRGTIGEVERFQQVNYYFEQNLHDYQREVKGLSAVIMEGIKIIKTQSNIKQ